MKIVKTVPFTLELAKKIVNKEVEGEIVTEVGDHPVRIICFDKKTSSGYPVLGLINFGPDTSEILNAYTNEGKSKNEVTFNLLIKLSEEIEEHEYIYYFSQQPSKLLHSEEINKIAKKIIVDGNIIKNRDGNEGPIKSQFKPFDKVLVRCPEKSELCVGNYIWIPAIFQYKSPNSTLYYASGNAYKECIPYEGNEHLVGTTNNPNNKI